MNIQQTIGTSRWKQSLPYWILPVALTFYLIVAYRSVGFHNADEHYQIIEFANYKLGITQRSGLAWEYEAAIRSGLQPGICFLVIKSMHSLGINDPYILAYILRALTGTLALAVMTLFINKTIDGIDQPFRKAYRLCTYFLWFLPYILVRFSSEAWSGIFFLWAYALIQQPQNKPFREWILPGLVFGLSVLFRYQMAIMLVGVVAWLIIVQRTNLKQIFVLLTAFLLVLAGGFFIDAWLYGTYTCTIYNYFYANIIQQVASNYGVSPWYEILWYLVWGPGPWGIFILGALLYTLIRHPRHLFVWAVFPFLMVHMIIPHKELRFLFPLAPLAPFLLFFAYQEAVARFGGGRMFKRIAMVLCLILAIVNLAGLLVTATKSAGNTKVALMEYIHWHYRSVGMRLLYIDGSNPYADWSFLTNSFYLSSGVDLVPVVTVWQKDIREKVKPGLRNLLVIPHREFTGERTARHLQELGWEKVFESIPAYDQWIISCYNPSLNEDNLMLYEWRH